MRLHQPTGGGGGLGGVVYLYIYIFMWFAMCVIYGVACPFGGRRILFGFILCWASSLFCFFSDRSFAFAAPLSAAHAHSLDLSFIVLIVPHFRV